MSDGNRVDDVAKFSLYCGGENGDRYKFEEFSGFSLGNKNWEYSFKTIT